MNDDDLAAMEADVREWAGTDCDQAVSQGNRLADHVDALVAEVRRLRAAASAVLFWRHADGAFVDGFMAQEKLDALAATFPAGYTHWPAGEVVRQADTETPSEVPQ